MGLLDWITESAKAQYAKGAPYRQAIGGLLQGDATKFGLLTQEFNKRAQTPEGALDVALNFAPMGILSTKNLSKYVLDEAGNPLTLYHGGPKFKGKFKVPEGSDKGIYFTDNPYLAQDQFALQHELAMRNKTGFGFKDVPEHMLESGEWDPKYFKFADVKKVKLKMNNPRVMDALDAKAIPNLYGEGHDGVIVKSTGDFGYKGGQYVVFDPNQIEFIK